MDRRSAILSIVGLFLSGTMAAPTQKGEASPVSSATFRVSFGKHSMNVVDLTHQWNEKFNFDPSHPRLTMSPVKGSGAHVGMRLNKIELIEHTGTHFDAPSHFGEDLKSVGEIPVSDLATPIVVLDISEKAKQSGNAQVEIKDIVMWEKRHGRLPDGCCVAVYSGLDPVVEFHKMRSLEKLSATGFGPEAAKFLMEHRSVKGLAVDSLTLDSGAHVPDYPVHQLWLRSGRWGMEGITNLEHIPPVGALLVLGVAPVLGATGLPARAIALF